MIEEVLFKNGWILNEDDLSRAYEIHKYEKKLLGLSTPLSSDQLFSAFTYGLLSATENTRKLIRVHDKLRRYGYLLSSNVTPDNGASIRDILNETRFPNEKYKRFMNLGEWWVGEGGSLVDRVLNNSRGDLVDSMSLRNALAESVPGVGYKVASLIVELSINDLSRLDIIVIDKWVLKFLYDNGHSVEVPNYKTNRGPGGKDYLHYESILSGYASDLGVSPSLIGLMIWGRSAHFKHNKNLLEWC